MNADSKSLISRLRGRYPVGPIMDNGLPEFGYRDMCGPASIIIPPAIDLEAAKHIEQLEAKLADIRAININDAFSAELTELGASVWNKAFECVPAEHRPAPKKAGDVISTQLWDLMQVFGPHTWHGMVGTHFKDNSITKL